MDSLAEAIKIVRARIARFKGESMNEQDTKTALIDPILRALGWHVGDLDEVRMEYKRRPSDRPVDYALILMNTAVLFVEAKALGQDLDDRKWANQIMGYATVAGVEWVVITNGDEYRIYNALAHVPVEEKLFKCVRLTDQSTDAEDTLSLLSQERLKGNILKRLWEAYFVDRQMKSALGDLFSVDPDQSFVRLMKKKLPDLPTKDVVASLKRVRASFEFPVDETPPVPKPPPPTNPKSGSNFWEPIRRGECGGGVFAGKPVPEDHGWISKRVRGIGISLELKNHNCSVAVYISGEDRLERRAKILSLLPADKQPDDLRESPRSATAVARFTVVKKGRKDPEHWDEARKKLVALGEDIYNKIKEAKV